MTVAVEHSMRVHRSGRAQCGCGWATRETGLPAMQAVGRHTNTRVVRVEVRRAGMVADIGWIPLALWDFANASVLSDHGNVVRHWPLGEFDIEPED